MQFQLTLSLDNAEAVELGTEALPTYLADVGARAGNGYQQGKVRDGNGNTIGEWTITDQS